MAKRSTEVAMLTLTRVGQFTIKSTGPSHCGIDENILIKYEAICTCGLESLDHRGFLFEQRTIDKYFQGLKHTQLSCEKLVLQCAQELHDLLIKENPGCTMQAMTLMLSPYPHQANMRLDWRAKRPARR